MKIRRIFALCLALLMMILTSCEEKERYQPEKGEYLLRCVLCNVMYEIKAVISDDLSGRISFENDSSLSEWYYTYNHGSGKIRYRTSLGNERDADNSRVRMIFEFLLGENGVVSDVSSDTLDGRRVTMLVTSDGRRVYEDPTSGRPICLVYGDMRVDVLTFPSQRADSGPF